MICVQDIVRTGIIDIWDFGHDFSYNTDGN